MVISGSTFTNKRQTSSSRTSDQVIQDDVFARLLTFPNVIITGHQGFFTQEALRDIAETTLTNLTAFELRLDLMDEVSIEQVVTGERRREAT